MDLRVSKTTIFTFLLTLLLASGLRLWYVQHRDDCAPYLAGDAKAPDREYVVTGTRTIVVPCTEWLRRMPDGVQLLCIADVVLGVTFLLSAAADAKSEIEERHRRRAKRWDG